VNNGSDAAIADYLVDRPFIPNGGEPKEQRPPTQGLYSLKRSVVAVGEIVDCDDIEASVEQCYADMRANVAGAAGHQNHVEAFRIRPAGFGPGRPNCKPCLECVVCRSGRRQSRLSPHSRQRPTAIALKGYPLSRPPTSLKRGRYHGLQRRLRPGQALISHQKIEFALQAARCRLARLNAHSWVKCGDDACFTSQPIGDPSACPASAAKPARPGG